MCFTEGRRGFQIPGALLPLPKTHKLRTLSPPKSSIPGVLSPTPPTYMGIMPRKLSYHSLSTPHKWPIALFFNDTLSQPWFFTYHCLAVLKLFISCLQWYKSKNAECCWIQSQAWMKVQQMTWDHLPPFTGLSTPLLLKGSYLQTCQLVRCHCVSPKINSLHVVTQWQGSLVGNPCNRVGLMLDFGSSEQPMSIKGCEKYSRASSAPSSDSSGSDLEDWYCAFQCGSQCFI